MPRRRKLPNGEGTSAGGDNVIWTPEMDGVLLDVMLDEDRKGNRPNGTWSTTAFENMLRALRASFGPIIQKTNIKNRMKTLKRIFGECKDLFNGLSGFAWNPITKMFDAEVDVWEQLIKAKPEARKWMHTPVHNYDKLYELYAEQRATGEYAESAREKVQRWQKEGSSSQIDLNDSLDNFVMSDSEGNWANDMHNSEAFNSPDYVPSINFQGTSSSKGCKRKASMMDILATQYEKLNTSIDRVSEVLDRGNVIAEKSLTILESGRPHYYKEEEIYAELEMIGLQADYVLNAYCYLCNNPSATRSFFGLPRARRLEWLMKVIGNM